MSEEHKEPWLNYLAITTVVLAVFATLATYNGGKYSTKAVISQSQASDQWAFYQAKSIKGYQYDLQIDKLDLELKSLSPENAARVQDDFKKKMDSYKSKVQKYETEKADIMAEAKRLEDFRVDCQCHGKYFGYAIIYLQIGILLCAVAGFTKNKWLWLSSILLGALGVYFFIMGFYAKALLPFPQFGGAQSAPAASSPAAKAPASTPAPASAPVQAAPAPAALPAAAPAPAK